MRVIGIIAEYNPFHKGHEYLIEQARERVADPRAIVMSIMSGPFTQRGLPAIAPKHVRARQALVCGSNVVLELPFEFACAPASEFAAGAVRSLMATGVVTDIAFGVEKEYAELAERLADPEIYSSGEYREELKRRLALGESFPSANAGAVVSLIKDVDPGIVASALRSPNTILAVEYLKAMKRFGSKFNVHMIPREGQAYSDTDHNTVHEFYSASAIRSAIYDSCRSLALTANAVSGKMPYKSAAVLLSALSKKEFKIASLDEYALHILTCDRRREDIGKIRFMGDGLDGYIRNVLDDIRTGETDFESLSSILATKHFTMARICRALTMMLLGIHEDQISEEPRYIRVLGCDHDGRYCLKIMGKCSRLPVIHNCSDFLEHEDLKEQAQISLMADDLAGIIMGMPPGSSRDIPPVIL